MDLNYASDRRLDILILGPMSDEVSSAESCLPLQRAVQALLHEPEFDRGLNEKEISAADRRVYAPEGFDGAEIVHNVLSRLDTADLVIFNLTPKEKAEAASANVFYELGIVHALGVPAMFVILDGRPRPPFYVHTMKHIRVKNFEHESLKEKLRPVLLKFLGIPNSEEADDDYTNDRVTQFYGGLPILDISAAAGLATGYYFNFISRLLDERGLRAQRPDLVKHVVIVRPSSIESSYKEDIQKLKNALGLKGMPLCMGEKFDAPPQDPLGPLWFDHYRGIVVDIPRTIYSLQIAPRLVSYKQRSRKLDRHARRSFDQRLRQFGDRLLASFEKGIDFHRQNAGPDILSSILHFTTISEVSEMVRGLSEDSP